MRCQMPLSTLLSLSILGLTSATFVTDASAEVACSGHKLLPIPRPESSCSNVKPRIYPSPDGALRALVFPVDVSLYSTPDTVTATLSSNDIQVASMCWRPPYADRRSGNPSKPSARR